jgi:hypothetical protein
MIRSIDVDVGWELYADARLVWAHDVFYTFSIANSIIVLWEIVASLLNSSTLPWSLRSHEFRKWSNRNIFPQFTFNKDIYLQQGHPRDCALVAYTPDRISHFSWLRIPWRHLTTCYLLKSVPWLSFWEFYMQKSLLALALTQLEDNCLELRAKFSIHFAFD